ncbi:RHOMBOID-like protein 8 isoform X1 [Punica granatum]|uniref:RHOMBOID-like protein n=1 Tax=Punica granatum TaxID=22663 RepID=A0A6P8BP40_PUNGR|nr:RHOMBOID-like protein 8 isoform X1 [Punica granatum]
MAETTKSDTHVDIKPAHPPRVSFDFIEYPIGEHKAPFFRSGFRQRRDTWIISLFAILHIVAFIWTMAINNCVEKSHGDCAVKVLGRLSFQPLSENPLLGPSASTLDIMGALQRKSLIEHLNWRLFTFPCLHAGFVHLLVNLVSVMFVGILLEQEFRSLRIGMIYVLSGFAGSLFAALFAQGSPQVGASGALFGLLGAMLSGLIWNWKLYTDKVNQHSISVFPSVDGKFLCYSRDPVTRVLKPPCWLQLAALAFICFIFVVNFVLGMLPFIDNFASIGGFMSGMLLGFAVLYTPRTTQVAHNKAGLFDYGIKSSARLKQKLDKPIHRIVALLVFVLMFSGCLVAVLRGINLNHYCSWCRSVDCVLSNRWSCNEATSFCQTIVSESQMTLTCVANGNFRVFPFTNVSPARTGDLCSLICS